MSSSIAPSAVIHPGVLLGDGCIVEDFCVIGAPYRDYRGEPTIIGAGAWIRSHTVIYAGNRIGTSFETGNKANIRELNEIGNDVSIGTLTVLEHHVVLGDRVRIHSQAFIPEYSILQDDAWVGPNAVLTNARFPRAPDAKTTLEGPQIRSGAMIGANATILPGIVIGENALVGAGSVVTRNVAPRAIVAGNPARHIRDIHY